MEGPSSFAVYATAFCLHPQEAGFRTFCSELGGVGYLVALVGVVVALWCRSPS